MENEGEDIAMEKEEEEEGVQRQGFEVEGEPACENMESVSDSYRVATPNAMEDNDADSVGTSATTLSRRALDERFSKIRTLRTFLQQNQDIKEPQSKLASYKLRFGTTSAQSNKTKTIDVSMDAAENPAVETPAASSVAPPAAIASGKPSGISGKPNGGSTKKPNGGTGKTSERSGKSN